VRYAVIFAVYGVLAGCTETPSYFPPCVDPNNPCVESDGGADASDGGGTDAPAEATTADAH
jgi:hypothetical protein